MLPVEDDGLFFGPAIGDVHVGDSQAVGGRAVVVEEDVHLEQGPRSHVQVVADDLSVLPHGDAQHRLRCTSYHDR